MSQKFLDGTKGLHHNNNNNNNNNKNNNIYIIIPGYIATIDTTYCGIYYHINLYIDINETLRSIRY